MSQTLNIQDNENDVFHSTNEKLMYKNETSTEKQQVCVKQ